LIPEVIIVALAVAWILGCRPDRLADAPVRHLWLVAVPVVGFAISWALCWGKLLPQGSWVYGGLHLTGSGALILLAVLNRKIPGVALIGIGVALNAIAIAANGGFMPASKGAVATVFGQDYLHRALGEPHFRGSFMNPDTRLWWLCDIIPKSIGPAFWRGVYSIGDLVMTVGIFIAIIAVSRKPARARRRGKA